MWVVKPKMDDEEYNVEYVIRPEYERVDFWKMVFIFCFAYIMLRTGYIIIYYSNIK